MNYKGYTIEASYMGYMWYDPKDDETGGYEFTEQQCKESVDDHMAESTEDIYSCCGDPLPDNRVCPTCKEHN